MIQLLNDEEDIDWLFDTHLAEFEKLRGRTESFIILGQEDSPDRVTLYMKSDPEIDDVPLAEFHMGDDGDLIQTDSYQGKHSY